MAPSWKSGLDRVIPTALIGGAGDWAEAAPARARNAAANMICFIK